MDDSNMKTTEGYMRFDQETVHSQMGKVTLQGLTSGTEVEDSTQ
jgi:hypothetical protein